MELMLFDLGDSSFHDKSWSKLMDSRYSRSLKLASFSLQERAAGLSLLDYTTAVSTCVYRDILLLAETHLNL